MFFPPLWCMALSVNLPSKVLMKRISILPHNVSADQLQYPDILQYVNILQLRIFSNYLWLVRQDGIVSIVYQSKAAHLPWTSTVLLLIITLEFRWASNTSSRELLQHVALTVCYLHSGVWPVTFLALRVFVHSRPSTTTKADEGLTYQSCCDVETVKQRQQQPAKCISHCK